MERYTPTVTTIEALDAAIASLAAINHRERQGLPHSERLRCVERAHELVSRAGALQAVLVAEADAAGSSLRACGTPLTSWMAQSDTITAKQAAAVLFAGQALAAHPATRDAALAGTVSVQQARQVGQAIEQLPDGLSDDEQAAVEADLLSHASAIDPRRLDQAARAALARVAPQRVPEPVDQLAELEAQRKRAHARRGLSFSAPRDGSVDVRGSLPTLEARKFEAMINAAVETLRRDLRDGHDRLDPLAALPTLDQRRADALAHLVDTWAGAEHAPRNGGDRPRVVVVMHETELRARAEQAGVLTSGDIISAGELRQLCCDAELTPLVLGGESEILDVGRSKRLVTPPIRLALTLRDGGCVFPGCDAPPERCEAHHTTPWKWGGATSLTEMVLVCPHHHRIVEPRVSPGDGPPVDQWEVRFDEHALPYLLPPRRLDPERSPRRNTRARLVA